VKRAGLLFLLAASAFAEVRTPWVASRIHGTPEPPKPFVAEQIYPQIPLSNALDMVPVPGSAQWLIAENGGKIWSVPDDPTAAKADLVADLKTSRPALDHVYGIAFHPNFVANQQVFITYTVGNKLPDGTRLSRFKVTGQTPLQIDPESEEIILTWLSGGHNGAAITFGADGYLYVSTGDAEVPAPPDPLLTGQDISDWLSSILRIDIDRKDEGKAYAIPKDNPFISMPNAKPEIWAYGLRNPWKMSFDRQTGNLWCGDVGWELWENIYLITRGGNYGWSSTEGNNSLFPERKGPTPISSPIVTHSHTEAASITGGFVYRGTRLPELDGAYVYADYETGKIWALWHDGNQITRHEEIADTPHKIVTFGQNAVGEICFIHYGIPSTVHRLARNPHAGENSSFPRKLSETGLFTDVANQTPAAGVVPFDIHTPMWADGAKSQRFVGMVSLNGLSTQITTKKNSTRIESRVTWPKDAVLAKTIRMELETGKPESTRNIETQILHFDGEAWAPYSYRWNDAGTDADLVGPNGDERKLDLIGKHLPGGKHQHTYRFHSRGECMRCHNSWSGFALAFQPQQLTDASARMLTDLGLIDADYSRRSETRLSNPHDESLTPEVRARSWLHANCAHCHRQHGGGSVPLMVNAEMAADEMRALGEKPTRGDFGMKDAQVIMPGSPWKSVLLHRVATSGAGHMPMIGAQNVDEHAIGFLAEWILTMAKSNRRLSPNSLISLDSPETALDVLIMRDMLPAADFEEATRKAAQSPNPHIRGLFEHFLPDHQRVQTLGPSASLEKITTLKGDPKRGADLFSTTGKAATCLACHFIHGSGRDFGPDLSRVGVRLTQPQIIESLLTPSKTTAPGFQTLILTLQDGTVQTGFLVKQDTTTLALKIATGQTIAIETKNVKSQQLLPISLMPEGLLQTFTAQEAADLTTYLSSLK
jgi:putative heme-binding domain-containing protein